MRNNQILRAFTLVELLVVIAIISVLAALLLPALENTLAVARITACSSQERQLYLGMVIYAENHNGGLAKPDLGRTNGSFGNIDHSICNDRPVGDSFVIQRHGAWLMNEAVSTDLYFCPDISYEYPGDKMAARKAAWKTDQARTFFASGGMEGNASRNACTPTSYCLNSTIRGAPVPSNQYPLSEMNTCTNISRLESSFPILSDVRTLYNTDFYHLIHHGGRGFNVLGGDGAVRFLTPTDFVANASYIYSPARNYYNPWKGIPVLPNTPQNPIDQTPWADWNAYFPANPFGMPYSYFWQGAMAAMKHGGK